MIRKYIINPILNFFKIIGVVVLIILGFTAYTLIEPYYTQWRQSSIMKKDEGLFL